MFFSIGEPPFVHARPNEGANDKGGSPSGKEGPQEQLEFLRGRRGNPSTAPNIRAGDPPSGYRAVGYEPAPPHPKIGPRARPLDRAHRSLPHPSTINPLTH